MKVKLRNLLAGPQGVRHPGEVIEVDDDLGRQLLEGGYAERVDQPAEVDGGKGPSKEQAGASPAPTVYETAAVEPAETEALNPARKRVGTAERPVKRKS